MWKLIIVEDEPLVRRTIVGRINWQEHGFQLVGEAGNGQEALELIHSCNPDLVITDIVMPLMDGIELLKETRTGGWDCRFLMLTCMNEFEFARQALEYGASGYLLKLSMDVKSLERALHKIKRELESRAEVRELQAKQSLYRYRDMYRSLWDRFYLREGRLQGLEDEMVAMPSFSLQHVFFCAFLHDNVEYCMEQARKIGYLGSDEMSVRSEWSSFTQDGITTVFCWSDRTFAWKAPSAGEPGIMYAAIYAKPFPASELGKVWFEALLMLDRCWHDGRIGLVSVDARFGQSKTSSAVFEQEVSSLTRQPFSALSWSHERELLLIFEQSKVEACKTILDLLWNEMMELTIPVTFVKETTVRLDRLFARIVNHPGLPSGELTGVAFSQQLKELFWQRIERYLQHKAASEEELTDHEEINKIIRFIRQNYDENITLKSMARYVAMEEHYVSRLFKSKVGENLINYVQHYRVEKAKVFLAESDLSVSDVGCNVGFSNDNYFIKIFKRVTGITPSVYRKRMESQDEPQHTS
ncbi:helix-turn-helix domain-containing protein [Paenibacillus qinlingensis]|uniref:helix-turn-helix domain-containing protein n=1 Tax=Paenibacillus qinlingensis TaxID=1837343 RepID=UPI001FE8C7F8|nr:helix-turn-helix domain-containing protein [Paenibacillus qinlingensis]